jgi:hypothetical protein
MSAYDTNPSSAGITSCDVISSPILRKNITGASVTVTDCSFCDVFAFLGGI